MSMKGVLFVLTLVTALPAVLSYNVFRDLLNKFVTFYTTCNCYDFEPMGPYGREVPIFLFYGYPMFIINIPFDLDAGRVEILNEIMVEYSKTGLRILAFPTDEFSIHKTSDELLTPSALREWIDDNQLHFHVFNKIHVNGDKIEPLYNYLEIYLNFYDFSIKNDYTIFSVDQHGYPNGRLSGDSWDTYEQLAHYAENVRSYD